MVSPALRSAVAAALASSGLVPRGWLAPGQDNAPRLSDGTAASSVCLVGHGGGEFWPVFEAWWRMHPGLDDPLDSWSKAMIDPVAVSLGGEAVFPSDRPWHPFQHWAMAAEGLRPSPIGILMHPDYGLWHGYRGAILFAGTRPGEVASDPGNFSENGSAAILPDQEAVHPCDRCDDKPCLSACPVGAFSMAGFAVADCRSFLRLQAGQEGCLSSGCLARDACPVGREHRYGPEQIRFHVAAFA